MEKIKLVIWDLDETFWKGTLSEEGIEIIQENVDLIKSLTDRGIINSIVSKNDFEMAKSKLIELGIWNLFVFPAIEWAPKGILIKNIIENCQLRDVNVLFLDDNHLNLEEAKFYNKKLHTKFPDFIPEILEHKAFKGKDDSSHSRLTQYKILEDKNDAKLNFTDNKAFLKSSNIKIEIITDLSSHTDRVYELTERTNQLNFTKVRPTIEEVDTLINSADYDSAILKVKDNFGDYGVVGFYSIEKSSNKLIHFVFSCRILNLGVAQYVYSKLGFLELDIIPKVAETLDKSTPDWITEFKSQPLSKQFKKISSSKDQTKVLFKGGCDLGQMLFYLKGKGFEIEEETNYVTKDNISIHQEHTQVLLDSINLSENNKSFITDSGFIPFTDNNFYQTNVFNHDYKCLVYSVLMDYTQDIYTHKDRGISIPVGGYSTNWVKQSDHAEIVQAFHTDKVTTNDLLEFSNNFEYHGQISPAKFKENLALIRKNVPQYIPIIFINGAEVSMDSNPETGSLKRHQLMNEALAQFVHETENAFLLDVRTIITSQAQLGNNLRHYNREVYQMMSSDLLSLLQEHIDKTISTKLSFKQKALTKVPIVLRAIEKLQALKKTNNISK